MWVLFMGAAREEVFSSNFDPKSWDSWSPLVSKHLANVDKGFKSEAALLSTYIQLTCGLFESSGFGLMNLAIDSPQTYDPLAMMTLAAFQPLITSGQIAGVKYEGFSNILRDPCFGKNNLYEDVTGLPVNTEMADAVALYASDSLPLLYTNLAKDAGTDGTFDAPASAEGCIAKWAVAYSNYAFYQWPFSNFAQPYATLSGSTLVSDLGSLSTAWSANAFIDTSTSGVLGVVVQDLINLYNMALNGAKTNKDALSLFLVSFFQQPLNYWPSPAWGNDSLYNYLNAFSNGMGLDQFKSPNHVLYQFLFSVNPIFPSGYPGPQTGQTMFTNLLAYYAESFGISTTMVKTSPKKAKLLGEAVASRVGASTGSDKLSAQLTSLAGYCAQSGGGFWKGQAQPSLLGALNYPPLPTGGQATIFYLKALMQDAGFKSALAAAPADPSQTDPKLGAYNLNQICTTEFVIKSGNYRYPASGTKNFFDLCGEIWSGGSEPWSTGVCTMAYDAVLGVEGTVVTDGNGNPLTIFTDIIHNLTNSGYSTTYQPTISGGTQALATALQNTLQALQAANFPTPPDVTDWTKQPDPGVQAVQSVMKGISSVTAILGATPADPSDPCYVYLQSLFIFTTQMNWGADAIQNPYYPQPGQAQWGGPCGLFPGSIVGTQYRTSKNSGSYYFSLNGDYFDAKGNFYKVDGSNLSSKLPQAAKTVPSAATLQGLGFGGGQIASLGEFGVFFSLAQPLADSGCRQYVSFLFATTNPMGPKDNFQSFLEAAISWVLSNLNVE